MAAFGLGPRSLKTDTARVTRVCGFLYMSHRLWSIVQSCPIYFSYCLKSQIVPEMVSLSIYAKVYGVRYLLMICCRIIISWELQAVSHLGTFAQCALHCLLFSKLKAALLVSNSSLNNKVDTRR